MVIGVKLTAELIQSRKGSKAQKPQFLCLCLSERNLA